MPREEVLQVVTHTGDCYRIKCRHVEEPFNFYVSKIGEMFLEQDATGLEYHVVSHNSIEWVERY
jgi:hypothetical protein